LIFPPKLFAQDAFSFTDDGGFVKLGGSAERKSGRPF